MAISVGGGNSGVFTAATQTLAITASITDRILIAFVVHDGSESIISVVWQDIGCVRLGSYSITGGGATRVIETWYVASARGGTGNLVTTKSAAVGSCYVLAGSYGNGDVRSICNSFVNNTGSDITPTNTVTSITGDMCVDCAVAVRAAGTPTATTGDGQSALANTANALGRIVGSYQAGNGAVVMDWTLSNAADLWLSAAVNLIQLSTATVPRERISRRKR